MGDAVLPHHLKIIHIYVITEREGGSDKCLCLIMGEGEGGDYMT